METESVFNKRLLCLLLLLQIVFYKTCYDITFKCAKLLHWKPKILIQLGCKSG